LNVNSLFYDTQISFQKACQPERAWMNWTGKFISVPPFRLVLVYGIYKFKTVNDKLTTINQPRKTNHENLDKLITHHEFS